jgi:hypothetical protein
MVILDYATAEELAAELLKVCCYGLAMSALTCRYKIHERSCRCVPSMSYELSLLNLMGAQLICRSSSMESYPSRSAWAYASPWYVNSRINKTARPDSNVRQYNVS